MSRAHSGGFVKLSWKTIQGVKHGAWAIAIMLGFLGSATICPRAYAQAEIDPDHFDAPADEPIPQPRTADSNGAGARYDRSFSLPYSVLCNGKNLAPGRYSISLHSDGKFGQVTLSQKGHVIEVAGAVERETPQRRDEVVVVENKKNGRTLSLVRVGGVDFVFGPKRSAASPDSEDTRAERLQLSMIALSQLATTSSR
jgi:hypothetical protein